MTIRFAAARPRSSAAIARALCPSVELDAVNDNRSRTPERWLRRRGATATSRPTAHEELLDAALRHFAQYGLNSAEHARIRAETALQAGDGERAEWWIAICGYFDRRMADGIVLRVVQPA